MDFAFYPIAFLTALFLSYSATRLVRHIALRADVVDHPDAHRKLHEQPTPLLGGVAVYLAFFVSLLMASALRPNQALVDYLADRSFWTLLGGGTAVLLVGLIDDVWDMRARTKFGALLVVSVAMYAGGDRIGAVGTPFGTTWRFGWLAGPITVFWFMGCMNSVNLIDGMDGAAAGVSAFASLTLFACALMMGNAAPAVYALCLAGSAGGFLVHNFPPASIYLGDCGSLLLGFLIATIGLRGVSKGATVVALLIPVIALGLPIIDTSLAIIRRWGRKLPISTTDREHLHHRLETMGLTPRTAALSMYGVCIVLAVFALLLTAANDMQAAWLLAALAVVAVVGVQIFARRELDLLRDRLGAGLQSMRQRGQRRAAAHVASGSMDNVDEINDLWDLLTEAAEDLELHEMQVKIRCPECEQCGCRGLGLDYEWVHPEPMNGETCTEWIGRRPLRVEGATLGEITVWKRTNGQAMGPEIPETLEQLAEAFAANACRVHKIPVETDTADPETADLATRERHHTPV